MCRPKSIIAGPQLSLGEEMPRDGIREAETTSRRRNT